jgi:hypothetical protein
VSRTVGLLHYPWGEDYGVERARPRSARRLYRRALAYKANPRDHRYMEALFREHHPDGELVDAADAGWREAVRGADVVLLFPDANGLGFGLLERELGSLGGPTPAVLNGRRRRFALNPRTVAALRLRRALERSMVVDALLLAALALATPALLITDLLRGRR